MEFIVLIRTCSFGFCAVACILVRANIILGILPESWEFPNFSIRPQHPLRGTCSPSQALAAAVAAASTAPPGAPPAASGAGASQGPVSKQIAFALACFFGVLHRGSENP